jgi:hypothetical protein
MAAAYADVDEQLLARLLLDLADAVMTRSVPLILISPSCLESAIRCSNASCRFADATCWVSSLIWLSAFGFSASYRSVPSPSSVFLMSELMR